MLLKFAFILLLNVVFALGESLFEDEKRLYNFGVGKRAYTYMSQYKRLPVYNFGLGKRSADGSNMYAFGLGKRSERASNDVVDEEEMEKRARAGYDFGLGKRLAVRSTGNYNFGLGKKAAPQYSFGLGKRLGHYKFGLGKRAGTYYGIGVGKKDRVYSFGLGKRYKYLPMGRKEDEINLSYDAADDEKRGQQFSFGLGKRGSPSDDLLTSTEDEIDYLSNRQIRSSHYSFGLGKRNGGEVPVNSLSRLQIDENERNNKNSSQ